MFSAPGEGKKLSDLCRKPFFDVRVHPHLHPSGLYGLHHPRKIPIPIINYFNQRLFNEDRRFAKSMLYIFMSHFVIERHILENQINVSAQKGRHNPERTDVLQLSDAYSVFAKLKGTPKYWQTTRTELVAKVEQLGPFHIFFTLSCADKRWTEIFTTVLKLDKGESIEIKYNPQPSAQDRVYNDESSISVKYTIFDTDSNDLVSDELPLIEFIEKFYGSKDKILENEILIVTRIFNNRVQSFIKNILMTTNSDRIPIEFYSYRVEFQVCNLYSGCCTTKCTNY